MDVDRGYLENVLKGIIKSNLVSFSISAGDLEVISSNLAEDISLALFKIMGSVEHE